MTVPRAFALVEACRQLLRLHDATLDGALADPDPPAPPAVHPVPGCDDAGNPDQLPLL